MFADVEDVEVLVVGRRFCCATAGCWKPVAPVALRLLGLRGEGQTFERCPLPSQLKQISSTGRVPVLLFAGYRAALED